MSVSVTRTAAERVSAQADERGLTQAQIGAIIGKSQGAAWRRMSGETPFTLADLEALAVAWGVPLAELIDQEESGS